eukprot:gnl/TRDRNA2_/TRDRNA2_141171_c1_seq3.p1 gnl/TRDRNA2_/TRDRNA2_141171_c1~~gnl/TRDRNA2_/TRDRNA2_141171_c1_seq3.p1  ORF type:complete len:132 (+),score=6.95 gnl/TRDRNA2_/TRDRNA2_141171_c1_seq3:24-419(+)
MLPVALPSLSIALSVHTHTQTPVGILSFLPRMLGRDSGSMRIHVYGRFRRHISSVIVSAAGWFFEEGCSMQLNHQGMQLWRVEPMIVRPLGSEFHLNTSRVQPLRATVPFLQSWSMAVRQGAREWNGTIQR